MRTHAVRSLITGVLAAAALGASAPAWAQDSTAVTPGAAGALGLVAVLMNCAAAVIGIIVIVGMWKVYVKAGKPGWAAIVPIYNVVVLLEIVGRPVWWVLLLFIPLVNVVIGIIVLVELAKCFGQGVGFAIGLLLLSFIFFPILGFGDARYQGPVTAT